MKKTLPIGTWVYNPVYDFNADEVDIWADCGLTCTLTPRVVYGKDDIASLIPFLDRAEERGIKLIATVDGLSDDNYEEDFRAVYKILGGHPALAGFLIADEPDSESQLEYTFKACEIQKKIAPELEPYLNMMGSTHERPHIYPGKSFDEMIKDFGDRTGSEHICFDAYTQVIGNEEGVNCFFRDCKKFIDAAEKAGVEPWLCPICSGHLAFQVPTEYQIIWQINVPVALGIRGLIWFRYYDRDICINCHGSPIDQFHHLTEHYYMMYRAQRIFNLNYGEIFMKLKHTKTFCLGKQFADYPMFKKGSHDLISIDTYLDSIISFFEDENGTEYLVIANASMVEQTCWPIEFDPERCSVTELTFNGKTERAVRANEEIPLYPGQMSLFRINRK